MDLAVMLLPYLTFFLILNTCRSSDTIDVLGNFSDGQTIVSANTRFELGFFSLGSSKNRYLGIWYKNTSPVAIAWVANRETPLIDTSGTVKLDNQGKLNLVNGSGKVIWSSNSSAASGTSVNLVAQLLGTGNLVIKTNNENLIWQSFDYPGDTYLPGMKLGKNFITGRETYLTSWMSRDDPSPGEYTLRFLMVKGKYPQAFIYRSSTIERRVGPYNGVSFSGWPNFSPDPTDRSYVSYMVVNDVEMYLGYISNSNNITYLLRTLMTPGGKLENFHLNLPNREWLYSNSLPVDYCDGYGMCGPYGSCNAAMYTYCGCLEGFERKTSNETSPDNDTSVCKRSIALDCGPGEGFQKFPSMKLPDTKNVVYNRNMSLQDCEVACKTNCSCTAYANPNIAPGGVGCLLWFGALIDVRIYPQYGQDLYVRLAASELSNIHSRFHRKKQLVMVVTLSIAAMLTLLGLISALYIRRKWKKRSDAQSTSKMGSAEVPLFSLSRISRATNDFSVDNKLGEGGFGPVYKGVLEEGQEIAVKRLGKSSRQGLDEFENEVICIAKLQHRNLVKLLGYCFQGDEKMLIYEFMPNKSLDSFLFDESRKWLLDWPKRFHIIHGIARGLLYLHQDSRLKVVHRDLKAGNVLLDHQMLPKISDFGLARMFKEDESEAKTKKVVGTLGYISPEYAANGFFSVKSDIFSFGVLVLEILSGKKNGDCIREYHKDNLLGHAWRLHKEGKSLDLIDECLCASYSVGEVLRSIHVGLLCVQYRVEDRPDTRSVVAMLDGEGSLPSPKKPAFFIEDCETNSTSVHSLLLSSSSSSVNGVTLSQVDGR